MISNRCS